MNCAIATIAIGENYQSAYEKIFKPSVQRYADRHEYDLIVFPDYIGGDNYRDLRFVTFMKMLLPYSEATRGYDKVMVLDVDVLVNAKTPPFHEIDTGGKIGVVDEWCQPSREERLKFQVANGLESSAREYYALADFRLESEILINSGVFICTPRVHGAFFRDIVGRHIETQRRHPRGLHFEQAMFGYELQTNGLAHLLPGAWNRLWPLHRGRAKWDAPDRAEGIAQRWSDLKRFREVFDSSFLLHMTGGLDHDLAFISRNR